MVQQIPILRDKLIRDLGKRRGMKVYVKLAGTPYEHKKILLQEHI